MRYFQDKATSQVFGFDDDDKSQQSLIDAAIANSSMAEITGNYPPSPTLDDLKKAQYSAIDAACSLTIVSGVKSSALGSPYLYPTQTTDQANLNANVTSSLLPNLPSDWTTAQICQDNAGNWAYLPHTAAEIQQVGADVKSAILSMLVKKTQLQAQVNAATTAAAILAITWSYP